MNHAPMRVLNMILVSTLVAASFSTTALAQGFAPTQDGKEITSARTQFNTAVPVTAVSSVSLIPAISFGGTGFANVQEDASGVHVTGANGSSYEAGVLAELGRHTVVFQTGLLYMNENIKMSTGYVSPYDASVQTSDISATMKYLAIPVVAKARVRIGNGVRLGARLGVMAAVNMGIQADETFEKRDAFGNLQSRQTSSDSDSRGLRAVNAIAVVGAGPEIRVARNQNVRIEANYERWLLPFAQDATDKITLHSWNAMLSYGIGF